MITQFIDPHDHLWHDFLETIPHDFYHSAAYVAFASKHEGGQPTAFYARDGDQVLLIPLLIRPLPKEFDSYPGYFDAVTPYGYPSPLTNARDEEALCRLVAAFRESCRSNQIVTAFIRFHPLLQISLESFADFGQLTSRGRTVYLDLSKSVDEMWNETSTNHRRNIRKLIKAGFNSVVDDWTYYDDFVKLYHETMRRVSAGEQYLFSREYFSDLKSALGSNLHLVSVLSPTGAVASAGLFTTCGKIVQYHLGGTAQDYLESAPSKQMFDSVRRWAKEMDMELFHLGGGVGAREDSLFKFKAGFSALTADFYTLGMVIDPEIYDTLVDMHLENCNDESVNYFPRYRYVCSEK